jgi:hypothetical protein
MVFYAIVISTSLLMIGSCKKDKPDDQIPSDVVTGTIMGKVVAQNGTTPIPMATVFVDVNGEIFITFTNKQGDFSLEAPAGTHPLYIESGRGKIFRTMTTVTVPESRTTIIPDGTVKLQQAGTLAYIAGAYDNIQDVIINQLGYTADEITIADLDNLSLLQSYSGLFLNCGKNGLLDANKYSNLLTYVNGGGSIYASDWAVEYLTGDGNFKTSSHIAHAGPKTCVSEIGGFVDDSLLCTDKVGPTIMLYGCTILPSDIQTYMGVTAINIEYDLGGWEQILDLDSPPWEVLIEDSVYGPLAIRMTFPGVGNKLTPKQDWVTICHIPPGNPANAHTITVAITALPAHLAHGDYVGSCAGNGGTIYYTTFHNAVQGSVSPDMQKMLEYFILNL